MKNANGSGSVYKLSGNRRKPYVAMVSTGTQYDKEKDKYIIKRKALGYFKTQNEARKCLADYNSHQYDSDLIGITFGEIWEMLLPELDKKLSKKRMESLRTMDKYLLPLANMRMADIRTIHLQKAIDSCQKSSSSKDVIKSMMNKVFEYALQNDIVSKNYTEFVEYQKDEVIIKRDLFDSEQIHKLLSAPFYHYDAITIILLYTGLRVHEFMDNTAENIDLENGFIYVPKELAKNKSSIRYVPIHDAIVPLLEKFISFNGEYIAANSSGKRLYYPNYYRYLKKQGHTPHDTRHTFVSRARECGIDHLVIQRIVGHTSKDITEVVYTHISLEELKESIKNFTY